jgi:HTH-type transcriptional regulator/antitoxin HigA
VNVVRVPEFLMGLGVRFVIVPHLSKTFLDGAALHLDDDMSRPVIALTLRYNRIDNFWFTLMHEIAHIVLEHEGLILDNLDDGDVDEKEREANEMARDWLLAPSDYDRFIEETGSSFSDAKIKNFAMKVMIHPGIIVGRLRKEEKVLYTKFGTHLVQIKNNLQDWIDVAAHVPLFRKEKSNFEKFEDVGLVGCCDVEEDLSVTYKSVLAESLESKYDHR